MKTIRAAEMDYGPDEVEGLRKELIILRDHALGHGIMGVVVSLSHTIAVLAAMKEEIWNSGSQ